MEKYKQRLRPSIILIILSFNFIGIIGAQDANTLLLASHQPMIKQYALAAKSAIAHPTIVKDIAQKIGYEKTISDRIMGRNLPTRFSKSPFLIKEICRIGKHLNQFRSVHSKCGNVTYRLNENSVSMKFYLTRYYMNQ